MKAIAVAARRSALEVAGPVVDRAGVALGYALAVVAGVGLGLWLLISLIGLGAPATSG
jgi:hypothetical protein